MKYKKIIYTQKQNEIKTFCFFLRSHFIMLGEDPKSHVLCIRYSLLFDVCGLWFGFEGSFEAMTLGVSTRFLAFSYS